MPESIKKSIMCLLTHILGTFSNVSCRPAESMLYYLESSSHNSILSRYQTRMQIVNASSSIVYSGLSNAVLTISRAEGVRSLWRGLSSVVAGAGMTDPI